jgi:hypothetical protein
MIIHSDQQAPATLEWAAEHQDELRANWDRARAHEQLVGIDPLP